MFCSNATARAARRRARRRWQPDEARSSRLVHSTRRRAHGRCARAARPARAPARIRACARFADDNIGQLLHALRANRLDDSTVVLVHSDHGFSLGERNACKKTSRADANRVPLILRAPGMAAAGRRSHALVELVDIFATVVELAGLGDGAPATDGRSFAALLDDDDSPCLEGTDDAERFRDRAAATALVGCVKPHVFWQVSRICSPVTRVCETHKELKEALKAGPRCTTATRC